MRYLLVLLIGVVLFGLTACPEAENGGSDAPAATDDGGDAGDTTDGE